MNFQYFFVGDFYTRDRCLEIANTVKANIDPKIPDVPAENVKKTVNVGVAKLQSVKHVITDMFDLIEQINKDGFNFDLYRLNDFDTVNYNEYTAEKQGEYGWHTDFPLYFPYDLKLTVLVNISTEPYEGGTFEIFSNGPKQVREFDRPGSVLVFPSWTPHRVTPVTSGTRKTMALFVSGPKVR